MIIKMACPICSGSGSLNFLINYPPSSSLICGNCHGTGIVEYDTTWSSAVKWNNELHKLGYTDNAGN